MTWTKQDAGAECSRPRPPSSGGRPPRSGGRPPRTANSRAALTKTSINAFQGLAKGQRALLTRKMGVHMELLRRRVFHFLS
eukprot:5721717-Pleurochrysis_carterae.AAC.2